MELTFFNPILSLNHYSQDENVDLFLIKILLIVEYTELKKMKALFGIPVTSAIESRQASSFESNDMKLII